MEGLITKFLNEKVIGSLLISVRVLSDIRTEMDHCSSVSIETRSSVFFFFSVLVVFTYSMASLLVEE